MTPILLKELRPGKWYIVYHANGRRWVRKVSENKTEAERIRAALEKRLLASGYRSIAAFKISSRSSALTFAAFADQWLIEVKNSGLKPSTKDSYELQVRMHLKPYFGDLPLADLSYTRVKEFIADKLSSSYAVSRVGSVPKAGSPVRPYSKDTIRLMIAALRAMMEEAVREGLIEDNPVMRRMGKLYGGAGKMREAPDPFNLEELHRLEAIAGSWLPFLLFQARTGVRVGEAQALQWQDLDLDKGEAFIRRNIMRDGKPGTPKTKSSLRTVDLSPQLVEVLRDLHKQQREIWFAKGEELPPWVFCKSTGAAPDYHNWRRAFLSIQKRAKIGRMRRVHDIRHTWASQMLMAGKPLAWVSRQLGHRSPAVTLSIYTHWIPGEDHGAKDLLDVSGKRPQQQTSTE